MKRIVAFLVTLAAGAAGLAPAAQPAADPARVSTLLTPDGGRIVIEAQGVPAPVPLFFSATVDHAIQVGTSAITGEWRVRVRVVQGRPELFTLGLSGDGEIMEVTGSGLRDWSVRRTGDNRLLDLRPLLPEGVTVPREFEFVVRTRQREPAIPGTTAALIATPGEAVGFAARLIVRHESAVDLRVSAATGMIPLESATPTELQPTEFHFTGSARLELRLARRGAAPREAEVLGASLSGQVDESSRSVAFRLRGQLRALQPGARVPLLAGAAALVDRTSGDGWHIELVTSGENFAYELVAEREGLLAIDLGFAAALQENGDWRGVDFQMPAGAVVPLVLEGLGPDVEFSDTAAVVPAAAANGSWQGFLPANGSVSLAWKRQTETGEETLSFTSFEQTDVRVGAGLMRQTTQLTFRLLQGKLPALRLRLEGPGEVLGVDGPAVTGWKVLPDGAARVLEVRLSRPFETEGVLVVRTQAVLGSFPVRAEPARFTPVGGVRHSGFVRVTNSGAVRLEVADVTGMLQLAPAQFPGAAVENGTRQVFVYRFPAATYGYRVVANHIQPEVAVTAIVTYELGETDRIIIADLELDVREAPLRDWSLRVPADYAVVGVTGSEIADYVAETEASARGDRIVKILFTRAVDGRQLVSVRLEKNQAAAAGEWSLPRLGFPGAKSVRGHVGVLASAGYRVAPRQVERLVEVPLNYFPKQLPGLQQTWRVREPEWTASLTIEALGQSVQADVFHLYSLKEGVVHGSVLLNYFVVGAPASEWRIEIPEAVGNLDVTGLNVRRDWRREGNQVIVSLHQPVLGAATILVTFEQPMSARGGAIRPGEIRPVGVQGERGFIQVVSPLQVKHAVRTADGGLLPLEPRELPAEFRLLTSAPSLAVFQYTTRPFALELAIEWYEPGEMVDQVVDFARLSSQVSRDGQVVTDARFFVKTRGRKALRMVLPEGMKLWEARVDQVIVNAHADGDQMLVPLPPRLNPNEPVEVALRLGQVPARRGNVVTLTAPRLLVPVVINEWTLHGDPERQLVPRGGNAELVRPPLTETGFEWISERGATMVALLLALLLGGIVLLRAGAGWRLPAGLLLCGLASFLALVLTLRALQERRVNLSELTYAATVVPAGETILLHVSNVVAWRAMLSAWGLGSAVAGAVLLLGAVGGRGQRMNQMRRALLAAGLPLLAAGLLAQHGGAALFFGAVGVSTFLFIIVLGLVRWERERRQRLLAEAAAGSATGLATALAFATLLGLALAGAPPAQANDGSDSSTSAVTAKPLQSLVQAWTIREGRLVAEVDVTVRAAVGDSFRLLSAPAVLTDFRGDGLRVVKLERDGTPAYYIVPDRAGMLTAKVRYELAVPDFAAGIALPTGPAAAQRVVIDLDQEGWEFTAEGAVQIILANDRADQHSGATLVLAPGGAPVIRLQPRQRDVAAEATQFFAETSNLYLPGPGVVNAFVRVTIRPTQGRVAALDLTIPENFTVGDVARGPVGAWRFDPVQRRLHVAIAPAQTGAFHFDIEMQSGTTALPVDLALAPVRVTSSAGEVGMIALAFGGDAQPEGIVVTGLSVVNLEDFDAGLMPRTRDGHPFAALQHAWRFGAEPAGLNLKVAPVAPEIRVSSRQLLSLGDDRLVLKLDLAVAITRVGLFQLSFVLPEGLEVEAASGAALSQWTEAQEPRPAGAGAGPQRVITLHLNGRTIGDQAFSLTLVGAAPAPQADWVVPRVLVREATRHTGEILLVPEKGIRLRAVGREHATQLDPRAAGGLQPGTLAFRLLQDDWSLRVGIEALEPWVTLQALQDVTMREGQTLTRIGLRYRVDNAAVKQLRVRLAGLTGDQITTVRATGTAVSDFIKVADETDVWEIRFQRGIIGETDVQIEYQGQPARAENRDSVATPEFMGARQTVLFVAVRAGGRLELEASTPPRGWQRVDWAAVPVPLQDRGDRSVPALCFRVAEPEGPLAVIVRRHEVAEALKLRVKQAGLTTIFAASGSFLTAVELKVDVLEKSTLRVRLPAGARLFNTFVNGQSLTVVREGDAYLFHVTPNSEADPSASVHLVYALLAPRAGVIELAGPSLSVPLENVSWRVVIPPGHDLSRYAGGLRLRDDSFAGWFGVEQYQSLVVTKRSADAEKATAFLEEANSLLQRGEQERAGEMLSRALYNNGALDEAANEDARVQLRALKEQQAVLGLNTRRQRLYLDNRGDSARNEQLEQAATINPFMQGRTNFDPGTVDQLLMGNTAEENSALRGIAMRIVDQQLDVEPATGAIDLTLPERGRVLTFTRTLQVDGTAPLALQLELDPVHRANPWLAALALVAVALAGWLAFPRRVETVA